MMATIASFTWSKLNSQELFNLMYTIKDRIVDQHLTRDQFHNIVIRHLKNWLPIKTQKHFDLEVLPTWVYIGGTYYSDFDQDRKKSIGIVLAYNKSDKTICMNSRRFTKFCTSFADTILHEIIHMRQFRKRKFKSLPDYPSDAQRTKQREEQEYLGNNDEIDAYSFNIACELDRKFNSDSERIVKYLNENQKGLNRSHNSWRMYLKAFGHDHNHAIIRRVKKRVIYYLPKARLGKPFQNREWITR